MSGPGFSTKVLLGSGGISTEARRATYRELVGEHFSGCQSIVFVPFASDDHEHYTSRMQDFLGPGGPRLVGIHNSDDPRSTIRDAEGIYVGGGNSFLLIRDLHDLGLVDRIGDSALSGAPYLGVSAGSNVACPTMMTTNDMPIVLPVLSGRSESFLSRLTRTTTRARSCSWMVMSWLTTTGNPGPRG